MMKDWMKEVLVGWEEWEDGREVVSIQATGLTLNSDKKVEGEGIEGEPKISTLDDQVPSNWELQKEHWQNEHEISYWFLVQRVGDQ